MFRLDVDHAELALLKLAIAALHQAAPTPHVKSVALSIARKLEATQEANPLPDWKSRREQRDAEF